MSGCPKQILPDRETPEQRVARLLDEFTTALEEDIHASPEPFLAQCINNWEKDQFTKGAPLRVELVSEGNVRRRHLPSFSLKENESFFQRVVDGIVAVDKLATGDWLDSLLY